MTFVRRSQTFEVAEARCPDQTRRAPTSTVVIALEPLGLDLLTFSIWQRLHNYQYLFLNSGLNRNIGVTELSVPDKITGLNMFSNIPSFKNLRYRVWYTINSVALIPFLQYDGISYFLST